MGSNPIPATNSKGVNMPRNIKLFDRILEKMWKDNPYDFRFVLMMTWERE
jgi:hypothetical protein